MDCFFCKTQAHLQENAAPFNAFCGMECQEIHYMLIAAGGKREREEQMEEGVDFTEILNSDILVNIMQRFTTFADLLNLCQVNGTMRDLCNDPQFQRMYLKDPNGKQMFQNFMFDLHRMATMDIRNLTTWIRTARELGMTFDSEKLIASAIRHNYLPMVIQEVEGKGFTDKTKQMFIDISLNTGRLSIFRFLHSRFPNQAIKFENAVWSGNMELIRYLYTLEGVNHNVSPDSVAMINVERVFDVASFLIQKNEFSWIASLLERIVQKEDSVFVEVFFRNVNPPKSCTFAMIENKHTFFLRNVVIIVKFIGDDIRGSIIANMIKKSFITFPRDDESFRWLILHRNLSKDDKIGIFQHLFQFYKEGDPIERVIEWMVFDNHVDPSFDDNLLYNWFKPLRKFLSKFPQVRAALLVKELSFKSL